MRTIIICSGGEDGKDVRTAIHIEDELFEKMFGSHIKDAMSFDDVELYLETAVEKIKSSYEDKLSKCEDMERIKGYLKLDCENVDRGKNLTEMSDKIKDLEDRLDKVAKQRNYFKDKLDKLRVKEKELAGKDEDIKVIMRSRNGLYDKIEELKDELNKRDREIEQLKEAVVKANENADSYYKLYSSERDAHKKASCMADDLNADFLEVREIVADKCDHWARCIWDHVNSLCSVYDHALMTDDPDVMGLREMANDISDFGANNAEVLMEEYEKEEEGEDQ